MKKVLIIDNYDSFTYNLVHIVEELIGQSVRVVKNDELTLEEASAYDELILSPGPGLPTDAGLLMSLIQTYGPTKKILGVCLGLQAIAEVYGAQLINLAQVYHGIQSEIELVNESLLFAGLPSQLIVGRYHSWVMDPASVPEHLKVTAYDSTGQIMSIEHREHLVYGIQYHPESIMTPMGRQILENFLFS